MALRRAKNFARFVMCGMISQYNNSSPTAGPKSMTAIVMQRIRSAPLSSAPEKMGLMILSM